MLGDGCLQRVSDAAYYIQNQSKPSVSMKDHVKWLQWVKDKVFTTLGIKATVKTYWGTHLNGQKKGQKYPFVHLWSVDSHLLTKLHDEWYQGGGWLQPAGGRIRVRGATKVVPKRLMEASVFPIDTLVHWFLGDGGSYWQRRESLTPQVCVNFATNCFTQDEVYHLRFMLNNMDIETCDVRHRPIQKKGYGLVIWLKQNSVDRFMNLILPNIASIFRGSISPSYKDMIKYKDRSLMERWKKSYSRARHFEDYTYYQLPVPRVLNH